MSADNWTICPKCHGETITKSSAARLKLHEQYGKIPMEEFTKRSAELTNESPSLPDELREDYELGVDHEGNFYVNYRCSCAVCGFSFSFKHEENILKEPPTPEATRG